MADENNVEEILKPFHQRASEAEARLERLEAAIAIAIAGGTSSGDEGLEKKVNELMSELQNVKAQHNAETQKVQKELQELSGQNAKQQYRILHLVRALEDADSKFLSKCGKHS